MKSSRNVMRPFERSPHFHAGIGLMERRYVQRQPPCTRLIMLAVEERPFLERSDRLLSRIDTGVALKWCLMALLTDIIQLTMRKLLFFSQSKYWMSYDQFKFSSRSRSQKNGTFLRNHH